LSFARFEEKKAARTKLADSRAPLPEHPTEGKGGNITGKRAKPPRNLLDEQGTARAGSSRR